MGLFGDTSSFTNGQYLSSPDVKQAIQGIDQSTGAKLENVVLAKADAKPVSGQTNDTPADVPNSQSFNIDSYRNGNQTGDQEQFNARTLAATWDNGSNQSPASMTLRMSPGTTKTTDIVSAYTRFFLQSVVEAEQEKYQVVETFTGYYAFFFGKRPPIYRYSGLLLSDQNYRWNNDFKYIYENYFRGTSAVELNSEVIMTYDGRVVTGFPLGLTVQQDAFSDKGMPFTMDLLVVDHKPMSFSIDIASLLADIQLGISLTKSKIKATQLASQPKSGSNVVTSDNVTNGIVAPSSLSLPNAPSLLQPIPQLAA